MMHRGDNKMNDIEMDQADLKKMLDDELLKPESLTQTGIVKKHIDLILHYVDAGLKWDVIHRALNSKGVTLSLKSFQRTVYRIKKKPFLANH